MQVSFLIKDCRLNKLRNSFNLSWSVFEMPISILKSPMTKKFSYDSLAWHGGKVGPRPRNPLKV